MQERKKERKKERMQECKNARTQESKKARKQESKKERKKARNHRQKKGPLPDLTDRATNRVRGNPSLRHAVFFSRSDINYRLQLQLGWRHEINYRLQSQSRWRPAYDSFSEGQCVSNSRKFQAVKIMMKEKSRWRWSGRVHEEEEEDTSRHSELFNCWIQLHLCTVFLIFRDTVTCLPRFFFWIRHVLLMRPWYQQDLNREQGQRGGDQWRITALWRRGLSRRRRFSKRPTGLWDGGKQVSPNLAMEGIAERGEISLMCTERLP